MKKQSKIALKVFLEQCAPEKKAKLERFLPESARLSLANFSSPELSINPDLFTTDALLNEVHWSWFLPTLDSYSEDEQKLFLATLPTQSAKNLAKTMNLLHRDDDISKVGKQYLRQILLSSLIEQNDPPLPIEYLPKSSLSKLLTLSKKELAQLIDFLALHDLAEEIRQIVETKTLKKIYSFLSEEEKKFLKTISNRKDPITFGKFGLEKWDGTEELFRTLLHRKGLARFAIALSKQSDDFLWHIFHKLDIGRGNTLYKLCAKETSANLQELMIKQVEELL